MCVCVCLSERGDSQVVGGGGGGGGVPVCEFVCVYVCVLTSFAHAVEHGDGFLGPLCYCTDRDDVIKCADVGLEACVCVCV